MLPKTLLGAKRSEKEHYWHCPHILAAQAQCLLRKPGQNGTSTQCSERHSGTGTTIPTVKDAYDLACHIWNALETDGFTCNPVAGVRTPDGTKISISTHLPHLIAWHARTLGPEWDDIITWALGYSHNSRLYKLRDLIYAVATDHNPRWHGYPRNNWTPRKAV